MRRILKKLKKDNAKKSPNPSISFTANEHSLSVDVECIVRPNIEKTESNFFEKIPKDGFNQSLLMQKVSEFLQTVFDETIVLDFKE